MSKRNNRLAKKQPQVGRPINTSSWREHPWIAALIGGGAMAAFFMSIVLPIWSKVEQNRISDLESQVAEAKRQADPNSADHKRAQEQVEKIASQEVEIARLRAGAPFEGGNPYPRGFRLAHLGDPIADVLSKYADRNPVEKEDWIEIADGNPLFGGAVFYKDLKGKRTVIAKK